MLHLDTLSTLVAATMVLLFRAKARSERPIPQNIPFLNPSPAALLVALALLVLKKSMDIEIDFDMSLKTR